MKHIKTCVTFQKKDRTNPKHMKMQAREIVTIPSERVAIDIVGGPFPVAKGTSSPTWTWLTGGLR